MNAEQLRVPPPKRSWASAFSKRGEVETVPLTKAPGLKSYPLSSLGLQLNNPPCPWSPNSKHSNQCPTSFRRCLTAHSYLAWLFPGQRGWPAGQASSARLPEASFCKGFSGPGCCRCSRRRAKLEIYSCTRASRSSPLPGTDCSWLELFPWAQRADLWLAASPGGWNE